MSDVTAATSKSGCWSFLASFAFCSCLFLLLLQGNEALQAYIFQNIGSTNVMWQQINIGTDISKCHFTVNITVSVRADSCSWIRAIVLEQSEVKYRALLYYLREQGLSPRCVLWKLACCIFKRGRQPKRGQRPLLMTRAARFSKDRRRSGSLHRLILLPAAFRWCVGKLDTGGLKNTQLWGDDRKWHQRDECAAVHFNLSHTHTADDIHT